MAKQKKPIRDKEESQSPPEKVKPQKNKSFGILGMIQWILGGEASNSFGTTVFLLCLFVPIATCLSVVILVLCAAFGYIKMESALTLLRVVLGWPVIVLNIVVVGIGLLIHIFRKQRDMKAASQIVDMAERLLLANKGNANLAVAKTTQSMPSPASPSPQPDTQSHVSGILSSVAEKIGISLPNQNNTADNALSSRIDKEPS